MQLQLHYENFIDLLYNKTQEIYMAEFISSFITGFQDIVEKDLAEKLKGCKILNVFDGLIHYKYEGDSRNLEKIIYFNNTFFVLKTMKGKGISFPSLVGAVASEKKYYLINKGSFRVRFSRENQFEKVDKNLVRRAEETVVQNSKLKIDRLSPSTEIWYSIRSEGFGFCGQLISKREFTEKNLNKGELRPELAYLICSFAEPDENMVVLEPFCGYGSIPVQMAKKFRFSRLLVSDLDDEKIAMVSQKKQLQQENISVCCMDAMKLSNVEAGSVDLVITDPPWGYYEEISDIGEFYKEMFESFRRVLKKDGKMVVLSARVEELKKITAEQKVEIENSLHTLINGKKASLFKLKFI